MVVCLLLMLGLVSLLCGRARIVFSSWRNVAGASPKRASLASASAPAKCTSNRPSLRSSLSSSVRLLERRWGMSEEESSAASWMKLAWTGEREATGKAEKAGERERRVAKKRGTWRGERAFVVHRLGPGTCPSRLHRTRAKRRGTDGLTWFLE